jgi:hypothetical protein
VRYLVEGLGWVDLHRLVHVVVRMVWTSLGLEIVSMAGSLGNSVSIVLKSYKKEMFLHSGRYYLLQGSWG